MPFSPIPATICSLVGELYANRASHDSLDAHFKAVGAPGDPPEGAHNVKWKSWLLRASNDPDVDALSIVGQLLSEFMDLPPMQSLEKDQWQVQRGRIESVLKTQGYQYFPGGRILPSGTKQPESYLPGSPSKPTSVQELLEVIIRGLPRAMHPLANRRKGSQSLSFNSEYDIQDLLHSQLRPWIADIRPEEVTPSYAGSSTRMDFLLPAHNLVVETKRIRDKAHSCKVGDELIIDIEHYRTHPDCETLWCVIYDPERYIVNPAGIIHDLAGKRTSSDGFVDVRVFVFE